MEEPFDEHRKINEKANPFFTRGCSQEPKPYQNNTHFFCKGCVKLDVYDWLKGFPPSSSPHEWEYAEVRFKNNRKDIFRYTNDQEYGIGDIVAVEASPGHDIGIVNMTGEVALLQMKHRGLDPSSEEIKKIYRKARATDIEKWISAVENEDRITLRTRKITQDLKLVMKVNDVEFQGDNTKAIFYYTADERVDFRELIKVLAEEFHVRIEMKQIGVRQEASRLGGIGTCGRELCCSTWLTSFRSVTTNAARVQQLSLNPQKLAGQCSKLKCCLNYEYETYLDAMKDFPDSEIVLKTKKGEAIHQKTDIFRKTMWYAYTSDLNNFLAIPIEAVREIIQKNSKGVLPEKLEDFASKKEIKSEFESVVGQDDLTRFDD
ncbi:MAG: regulatory iron-sulfur-containing complex subunit RicT [Bacteroidetes bacterium]|nr:regulatory iron-sulfur-containing complex subunit RicT [Bacteroidota bacterium]